MKKVLVTGVPCSGTTITALLIDQSPDIEVDQIDFPHAMNEGVPHYKDIHRRRVAKDADLTVILRRDPHCHVHSLLNNRWFTEPEFAVGFVNEHIRMIMSETSGRNRITVQYQTLVVSPERVIEQVASYLNINTWANEIEIYDGDAKYRHLEWEDHLLKPSYNTSIDYFS